MPPRILYPFLAYRSFIEPILVLCAIVVPCWVVFRAYRGRSGGHSLSFQREVLLLTFVVYLAGLAAVTLAPTRESRLYDEGTAGIELRPSLASLTCSPTVAGAASAVPPFCARNAQGNLLLFFPLGIFIPLVWRRLRFWRGMRVAMAISLGIELTQYASRLWGSYRSLDVNDLILNVLGAAIGLGLVSLVRSLRGTHRLAPLSQPAAPPR